MTQFNELINLKKDNAFILSCDSAGAVFAPDLGARVFVELGGKCIHRLDIENIKNPNRTFNNYGGNNFWPAPEGGMFGFNYKGDDWRVQEAINAHPFRMAKQSSNEATAVKETVLENRKGTLLNVHMKRTFSVSECSSLILELHPSLSFSYKVSDTIEVLNSITHSEALVSCWTLEQFDASNSIVSFCKVQSPSVAINFDFYEDPRGLITYGKNAFLYKTNGRQRGQVGIKKDSNPICIGYCDLERNIICVREINTPPAGIYFNIADNDQPDGPFSAKDVYSIFNSSDDMGFFELETVGGCSLENGFIKGSQLVSQTSFGMFDSPAVLEQFINSLIQDKD